MTRPLLLLFAAVVIASVAFATDSRFEHHTKKQVRARLGFPAQVIIDPKGREVWFYYWLDQTGAVQPYVLGFTGGRVTESSEKPEFEPQRLLSTDREADLQKIRAYLGEHR